jgi:nucleoside-diphosphate-sugar epimerase
MKILITGGTGAVGPEVISEIARRWPHADLFLVSRRPRTIPGCQAIVADLTENIDQNELLKDVLRQTTHVSHIAADVRWNQPIAMARTSNVDATRNLLKMVEAHAGALARFVFVSTAFVDAPKSRFPSSQSVEVGSRSFNNSYEWSKWEAEQIVRRSGLPWSIVRPSLIVGHSENGRIGRYNGLFNLLKVFARGLLPFVVGSPDARVDTVPSDVVAGAICDALVVPEHLNRVVWTTSGSTPVPLSYIIDQAFDGVSTVRRSHGLPPIVRPPIVSHETYIRLYKPLMREMLRELSNRLANYVEVFMPYLSITSPFVVSETDILVSAPVYSNYLPKSVEVWCAHYKDLLVDNAPYRWESSVRSSADIDES